MGVLETLYFKKLFIEHTCAPCETGRANYVSVFLGWNCINSI